MPERDGMPAVQRPPGEVEERRDHDPDRELPHELADEADRAEQRERGRDAAEDDLPERHAAEAEELLGESARAGGDDDQLEHRPAEALDDVERRRQVRAAPSERRAQQHHRRHARVGADQAAEPEQEVADDGGGDDRAERDRQRQREPELVGGEDEERPRDDHEQRDREVRPEEQPVERAEDAQALRNGLDAPGRRVVRCHSAPFAGMTRSRFDGCDLSPQAGHPGRGRIAPARTAMSRGQSPGHGRFGRGAEQPCSWV